MEWAPLMHRRYLLAAELPCILWAVHTWLGIRSATWRRGAFVAAWCLMVWSQGTVSAWRSGYLVGWQRGEDWPAAARWVESGWQPGDRLFCWAGLIEAQRAELPLSPLEEEYFSLPLRGLYRVVPAGENRPIEPAPLVGDGRSWADQLGCARGPSGTRAGAGEGGERIWIVFRGTRTGLQQRIRQMQRAAGASVTVDLVEPPRAFGKVAVACIRCPPPISMPTK